MRKKLQSAYDPRQYMISRDFEIFYYNDLHFHSVGSHSHDYYEFYFFAGGAVEMEIAGQSSPLRPGDMIVIPPGTSHRARVRDAETPYCRFVFWIGMDYCARVQAQSPDFRYLFRLVGETRRSIFHFEPVAFNAICSRLFALLEEIHTDRFGRASKIDLGISELLLYLNRSVYEMEQPESRREDLSWYGAITAFIEEHLEEEISLDRLSREFFISKYYISHLFQKSAGLSVHQFIIKKRLAVCCDAIISGAGVGEAYALCGFRDYSSFYRAFRKEYGMSPTAYQTLHRAGAPLPRPGGNF